MKRLITFLVVVSNCILLAAQYSCYTNTNYANRLADRNELNRTYVGPYHLRVFFHIIRASNGESNNSFPVESIPSCVQRLNNDYNPHNIYFDYVGMGYIDNTDFYTMGNVDSFLFELLINTNVHSDAIDIYLLPITMPGGGKASGIPGRALAIAGTQDGVIYGNSHILSHEMGHCLGLFHTFHGTGETGDCAELVNGTNCSVCGDYVCDTPADPHPLFNYLTGCNWINMTETDINGDYYHPDTRQIMAYVPATCMEHFSNGQGARMRAHIITEPILQTRLVIPSVVYVQNIQYNGAEDVLATDTIIAGRNVTTGTIGDVIVSSGADITYETGKRILLEPGFYVNAGARFQAGINNILQTHILPISRMKAQDQYMPLLDKTSWITVAYGYEPPTMAYIYRPIRDTLIGDKTHRVLKKYAINLNDAVVYPDVVPGTTTTYFYEDTENKQVYQYSGYYKQDILVYDFNLKLGDRLPITDSLRLSSEYALFTLDNISTIENAGYTRKVYTFKHATDSIVWIEGIGNCVDFTTPYAIKNAYSSRLLCVQKDYEMVYDYGDFHGYTCESVHSIYNNQSQEAISTIRSGTPSASKILRDGQIYILRGDKTYTLQGQEKVLIQ